MSPGRLPTGISSRGSRVVGFDPSIGGCSEIPVRYSVNTRNMFITKVAACNFMRGSPETSLASASPTFFNCGISHRPLVEVPVLAVQHSYCYPVPPYSCC